jgi:hypothetical protein
MILIRFYGGVAIVCLSRRKEKKSRSREKSINQIEKCNKRTANCCDTQKIVARRRARVNNDRKAPSHPHQSPKESQYLILRSFMPGVAHVWIKSYCIANATSSSSVPRTVLGTLKGIKRPTSSSTE